MSTPRFHLAEISPASRRGVPGEGTLREVGGGTTRFHAGRREDDAWDWFATARLIGRDVDLDISAHTHGAMLRRRGVPAATNLLCLALMYGPGRMSLRLIAERAEADGIAEVSEPALLRRLSNAGAWLSHVGDQLIAHRLGEVAGDVPRVMLLNPSGPPPGERQSRQAEAARQFIVDFAPWPPDLFSDAQISWLFCVRWTLASATLRDAPPSRPNPDATAWSALDRTRQLAHLIAAAVSLDT